MPRPAAQPVATSARDEGEEPRDVEVEPVRQDELKADQQRGRERRELERAFAARPEVRADSRHKEQTLQQPLDKVQVGDSRRVVLPPVPERERRLASDLPPESAIPENTGRVCRARLEQEN